MASRKEHQQKPQEIRRDEGRLFWGGDGCLAPVHQVECAVEMGMVPLRADFDHWGLAFGSPHPYEGRLEVQAHLIHRENG